ncbi:hypothetical protein AB0J74_27175 [Asanoa sp. NPDC049573]|uniref:hypothetical protein n=1 Tax=Asanoa sp. NPDC049573 TaxID=3155396 RepID=UPI0034320468
MFGRRKAGREAAREREAREAAGDYLLAGIAGDGPGVDDVVSRVDTFMLQAAVVDIAQRAVSALAQERGVGVDEVMTSLISDELPDGGRLNR